eukprot:Gb_18164 [translate_table: standard]
MGVQGSLTPDQLQFFSSEGYLVIEGFASEGECKGMMNRMEELLETFDPSDASIFSSKNQKELTQNHFYDSAEKISFFFEGLSIENLLMMPKMFFKVSGVALIGNHNLYDCCQFSLTHYASSSFIQAIASAVLSIQDKIESML